MTSIRRNAALLLVVAATAAFATTHAAEAIRKEDVRLSKRAPAATIKGRLQGGQIVDYWVRAGAGQSLTVTLRKSNPQNYFNREGLGREDCFNQIGPSTS